MADKLTGLGKKVENGQVTPSSSGGSSGSSGGAITGMVSQLNNYLNNKTNTNINNQTGINTGGLKLATTTPSTKTNQRAAEIANGTRQSVASIVQQLNAANGGSTASMQPSAQTTTDARNAAINPTATYKGGGIVKIGQAANKVNDANYFTPYTLETNYAYDPTTLPASTTASTPATTTNNGATGTTDKIKGLGNAKPSGGQASLNPVTLWEDGAKVGQFSGNEEALKKSGVVGSVGLTSDQIHPATSYKPGNAVKMTPDEVPEGTAQTEGSGGGGGYGGGSGGYGGGGGYGSASSLLGQLGLGEGVVGASSGYTPVATGVPVSEANAAAYAQLLKNAGYDLSQPLTDVALPNYVDLPNRVDLPENFNFQDAYNNIPDVQIGRVDRVDTHPEEEMLANLADLQQQQAILNADNTVKNGIADLQRTMQNAQNQYQAQRDQIAMDEQRALDNQVLYNEARGDRGGIGAEQYNSIQNTAATNRLTVQKEQTQLATDTARQIADLRSQGEFEKANQLLSISQKYLSELMDLYQWAKETNVSIDEFNLQVAQWEENFKLSLVGAELDAEAFNLNVANAMIDQENNLFNARFNQENSLFDARLNAAKLQNDEAAARLNAQLNAANAAGAFGNGTPTYAAQQDAINNQLKERQMLADIGTALIKAGIQPSAEILAAMGMGGAAATNTSIGINNNTLSGILGQLGYSDAESALRAMGVGNAGIYGLSQAGITPEQYLAEGFGVTNDLGLGLQPLDTASLSGGTAASATPYGGQQIVDQLYADYPNYQSEIAAYSGATNGNVVGSNTSNSPFGNTVSSYSPVSAGYQTVNTTPTYDDATIMAAFGATPEQVLRAAGIGDAGIAGIAALGINPAQLLGEAFNL